MELVLHIMCELHVLNRDLNCNRENCTEHESSGRGLTRRTLLKCKVCGFNISPMANKTKSAIILI
jgi:hypothetical protein